MAPGHHPHLRGDRWRIQGRRSSTIPPIRRAVLKDIMAARKNLHLPLARRFPGFRNAVAPEIVRNIAGENALFSLATAIPNIIPFLVAAVRGRRVRLRYGIPDHEPGADGFPAGGASGREIGYGAQKKEIASIVGERLRLAGRGSRTGGQDPAGRRHSAESGDRLRRHLRRSGSPSSATTDSATATASQSTMRPTSRHSSEGRT